MLAKQNGNKGGAGSGGAREGAGRKPGYGRGSHPASVSRQPRSGMRPIDLFPHGRNSDGTPKPDPDRSPNDPKPALKPRLI